MSKFYENYLLLCAKKGISKTAAALAIGLSNAAPTGWKNGKEPNELTLVKLSDYFGVPISELIGEKEKAPTVSGERRNIIKIVGRDGSVVVKELTDEQLSAYKTMVDHLPEADDL